MSVDGGMDQENRSRGDERWPDSGFILVVRTVAVLGASKMELPSTKMGKAAGVQFGGC